MNFNPEIQHYLAQSGNLVTTTAPIDATGPRPSVEDVSVANVGVSEPIPTTGLSADGFSFPSVTNDVNLAPLESQCPAFSSVRAYPGAPTIHETSEDVHAFETLEEEGVGELATADFQPAVAEEIPEEPFGDMPLIEDMVAENSAPIEEGLGVDCGYADLTTFTNSAEDKQLPDAPIQELENVHVEPFAGEVPLKFPEGHEPFTEHISDTQEIPYTEGHPFDAFPETDEPSEAVTSMNWQSSPVVSLETTVQDLPSKQLLAGSEEGDLETEPLIDERQAEVTGDAEVPKLETLLSRVEELDEDTGDVEVSELETGHAIVGQPSEHTGNLEVPELETAPVTGKQSGEESRDEKVPKLETLPLINKHLGDETGDVEGPKLEAESLPGGQPIQGTADVEVPGSALPAEKPSEITEPEQVQLTEFHSGKLPQNTVAEHIQSSAIYSEKLPEGTEAKQTQLVEDGAKSGIPEKDAEALKGRMLLKKFGKKKFTGNIVGYDPNSRWFKVVYEDGDEEELEWAEIEPILVAPVAGPESISKKRCHSGDDEHHQRTPKKAKKSVAATPKKGGKSPDLKNLKISSSGKKKGSKSPGISAKSPGSKGKTLKTKQEESKKSNLKKKPSSRKKPRKTKVLEQLQAGSTKKYLGKKADLRAKSAEIDSQPGKSPLKTQEKVLLKRNQWQRLDTPKSATVSKTRKGAQKMSSQKSQTPETQKAKKKKTVQKQVVSTKSIGKQNSAKKGIKKSKQQPEDTSPKQKGGTKRKADVVQLDSSPAKHVRWGDTGNTGGGKTLRSKSAIAVKIEEENAPSVQKSSALEQGVSLVGRMIRKKFGVKFYSGEVAAFNKKTKYYKVVYEDGDEEEVEWSDLQQMVTLENKTDTSSSKISGRKNTHTRPASQKKIPGGKKKAGKNKF